MPLGPPRPIATERPARDRLDGPTSRAPRRSPEAVSNTSAYTMAKRCHHMTALIERGRLDHATPEALQQLRDHVEELRAAIARRNIAARTGGDDR